MNINPETHGIIHFVPIFEPKLAQKHADQVLALNNQWVRRDK